MKKLITLFLFTFAALRLSLAVDNSAPDKPNTAPTPEGTLEIKNKSSFAMEESGRNPFWPIGWKPATKINNNVEHSSSSDLRESAFLVSSITVDQGGKFAIINGKVMTEGQVFGLQMGNQTYQITVKSIQDGQVILARRDQEMAIPLRRR